MQDQSVTLVGNLCDEPRQLGTEPGRIGARLRVACNERRRNESGEWQDGRQLFMDVLCWRGLAENVLASLGKGAPVVVVGKLRDATWTDKHDTTHRKIELDAETVATDLRRARHDRYPRAADEESRPTQGSSRDGADGPASACGPTHVPSTDWGMSVAVGDEAAAVPAAGAALTPERERELADAPF